MSASIKSYIVVIPATRLSPLSGPIAASIQIFVCPADRSVWRPNGVRDTYTPRWDQCKSFKLRFVEAIVNRSAVLGFVRLLSCLSLVSIGNVIIHSACCEIA